MSDPTTAQSPALMQVSSHLPGPATSWIYRLLPSPVCCSHLLDLQELGNGEGHTNALDLKKIGVSGAEPWPTLCCVAGSIILSSSCLHPAWLSEEHPDKHPAFNLWPSSPLPNPVTCLLWSVTDCHIFILFPLFIVWQNRKASQTSDCVHSK